MGSGYETDEASKQKKPQRIRTLSTPGKPKSKKKIEKDKGDKTDDEGYQSTHSTKSLKKKGSKFFRKFSRSSSAADYDDDKPPPLPAFPPSYSSSMSSPAPTEELASPMHLPIAARFATTLSFDSTPGIKPSSTVASPTSNISYETTASYFTTASSRSPLRSPPATSPPPPPPSSSNSFFQKSATSSRLSLSRSLSNSSLKEKEKNRSSGASTDKRASRTSSAESQTGSGFRITSPFKESSKKALPPPSPMRPMISYPLTRPKSPQNRHLSPANTMLGRPIQPRVATGTLSPNTAPSSPRAVSPNPRRGVSPAFPQKPVPPPPPPQGEDWLDMGRDSGDSFSSDDKSIYPDNRQTMYDDSPIFGAGSNARETMYTLSNGSRPESLAFLDTDHSSAARTRFVQGVEEMRQQQEVPPPVPTIPRELLNRRVWH